MEAAVIQSLCVLSLAGVRGQARRPARACTTYGGSGLGRRPAGAQVHAAAAHGTARRPKRLGGRRGQMVAAVHCRRHSAGLAARPSGPLVPMRLATSTAPRPDDGEWRCRGKRMEMSNAHGPAASHNWNRRRSDSRLAEANQLQLQLPVPGAVVDAAHSRLCLPSLIGFCLRRCI
ncbi:unnamed protein product [Urochloa humidicola]